MSTVHMGGSTSNLPAKIAEYLNAQADVAESLLVGGATGNERSHVQALRQLSAYLVSAYRGGTSNPDNVDELLVLLREVSILSGRGAKTADAYTPSPTANRVLHALGRAGVIDSRSVLVELAAAEVHDAVTRHRAAEGERQQAVGERDDAVKARERAEQVAAIKSEALELASTELSSLKAQRDELMRQVAYLRGQVAVSAGDEQPAPAVAPEPEGADYPTENQLLALHEGERRVRADDWPAGVYIELRGSGAERQPHYRVRTPDAWHWAGALSSGMTLSDAAEARERLMTAEVQ